MKKDTAWVVVAFATVVALFLGDAALWLSLASGIDTDISDMQVNSLPSVTHLSAARTELSRMATTVAGMDAAPEERRTAVAELQGERAALQDELRAYDEPPWYPGERERYEAQLLPSLQRLDAGLSRLARAEPSQGKNEWASTRSTTSADIAAVDRSVAELVTLNHDQSYASASRILHRRRTAARRVLALEGVVVGLAGLLGWSAVSAVRRLRKAEERHARLLEERANELELFAHRVAHDLLSPLAAVSYSLGSIERVAPQPDVLRAADLAKKALERTRKIVRGIFEYSRSGGEPVPGAHANVPLAVRAAVTELRGAHPDVPEVSMSPMEDCDAACEESVLGVVLGNLLENAATYSTDSDVRSIAVRSNRINHRVRLEVEDSGPGVPEGMERAIFEPHTRVPGTSQPGLGLGLATVDRLVTRHGGQVGVRRSMRGSVFWVELPIAGA